VPSIWQKFVVGLLLLVGVTLQSLSSRARPLRPILGPDDPAMHATARTLETKAVQR
jgi:hypothetical protein